MFPEIDAYRGTALDKAREAQRMLENPMNEGKVVKMQCFNSEDEHTHRNAFSSTLSAEQMFRVIFTHLEFGDRKCKL